MGTNLLILLSSPKGRWAKLWLSTTVGRSPNGTTFGRRKSVVGTNKWTPKTRKGGGKWRINFVGDLPHSFSATKNDIEIVKMFQNWFIFQPYLLFSPGIWWAKLPIRFSTAEPRKAAEKRRCWSSRTESRHSHRPLHRAEKSEITLWIEWMYGFTDPNHRPNNRGGLGENNCWNFLSGRKQLFFEN